jgi:glycosyltransferase involved in cell wall biosynthesis
MLRLDAMLRRERIDIINIHYPVAAFVYFAALRRQDRPLVVSIHGADLFPDGARRPRYSWELRTLLRGADRIVAPSRSLLDDFNRVFPDWAEKASFIHNGIEVEKDIVARHDTAVAPTLLCVAAHNEKKAIDVLLHAFARVRAVRPARLCLIGDGPQHAALVDLAERLGLSGSVEFLGWRPHIEVTRRMADATVVVLPSRAEPFGLVIAEAMATGAPVVASAAGGIPEIVTDGTDGLLVPPDDPQALAAALLRVVQDTQLGRRLGQQARETIRRRFLVEHMGAAYESLFMSIVHDDRHAG